MFSVSDIEVKENPAALDQITVTSGDVDWCRVMHDNEGKLEVWSRQHPALLTPLDHEFVFTKGDLGLKSIQEYYYEWDSQTSVDLARLENGEYCYSLEYKSTYSSIPSLLRYVLILLTKLSLLFPGGWHEVVHFLDCSVEDLRRMEHDLFHRPIDQMSDKDYFRLRCWGKYNPFEYGVLAIVTDSIVDKKNEWFYFNHNSMIWCRIGCVVLLFNILKKTIYICSPHLSNGNFGQIMSFHMSSDYQREPLLMSNMLKMLYAHHPKLTKHLDVRSLKDICSAAVSLLILGRDDVVYASRPLTIENFKSDRISCEGSEICIRFNPKVLDLVMHYGLPANLHEDILNRLNLVRRGRYVSSCEVAAEKVITHADHRLCSCRLCLQDHHTYKSVIVQCDHYTPDAVIFKAFHLC